MRAFQMDREEAEAAERARQVKSVLARALPSPALWRVHGAWPMADPWQPPRFVAGLHELADGEVTTHAHTLTHTHAHTNARIADTTGCCDCGGKGRDDGGAEGGA